jgi:hypothetical protein
MYDGIGPIAGILQSIGVKTMAPELWSDRDFLMTMAWIAGLALIANGCPNTLQILARNEPALGVKPSAAGTSLQRVPEWTMSLCPGRSRYRFWRLPVFCRWAARAHSCIGNSSSPIP